MLDVIGFWSDLLPVVAVSYLLQLLNGFGLGVHIASPCIFLYGSNMFDVIGFWSDLLPVIGGCFFYLG
jgi:hypothetical protein